MSALQDTAAKMLQTNISSVLLLFLAFLPGVEAVSLLRHAHYIVFGIAFIFFMIYSITRFYVEKKIKSDPNFKPNELLVDFFHLKKALQSRNSGNAVTLEPVGNTNNTVPHQTLPTNPSQYPNQQSYAPNTFSPHMEPPRHMSEYQPPPSYDEAVTEPPSEPPRPYGTNYGALTYTEPQANQYPNSGYESPYPHR